MIKLIKPHHVFNYWELSYLFILINHYLIRNDLASDERYKLIDLSERIKMSMRTLSSKGKVC